MPTHIPAKISLHKSDIDADSKSLLHGLIIDISPCGCRFAIHVSSGFVALKKRQVFVHILSPLDNEPVIITSYIRNNQMKGNRLSVGIEFDASEQVKLNKLLEAYSVDID